MSHVPSDPDFAARVRASFERQRVMHTIGARMSTVEPGYVKLELPFRQDLTQQHGFLHAGIVTTLLDSACGYAAFTLMDAGHAVLTVEFKTNLLAPAAGELLIAEGEVVRAGKTLTVCRAEGWMRRGGGRKHVATMQATLIALPDREGLAG
jgi:uncharacterized protein (TIGR00369 family)